MKSRQPGLKSKFQHSQDYKAKATQRNLLGSGGEGVGEGGGDNQKGKKNKD